MCGCISHYLILLMTIHTARLSVYCKVVKCVRTIITMDSCTLFVSLSSGEQKFHQGPIISKMQSIDIY